MVKIHSEAHKNDIVFLFKQISGTFENFPQPECSDMHLFYLMLPCNNFFQLISEFHLKRAF